MLEFAWSDENPDKWDADQDGVMEGRQHHTLDMELFGPSSWLQGFYLLALDCAAKIADALGENARAEKYRALYNKGKKWTNDKLWSGEYFYQRVELTDKSVIDRFDAQNYWNEEAKEIKYQVGEGCIIDQMLADYHAAIIGTDGIFDEAKKRIALNSLYKYNYKSSMREVTNMWRNFALNDERGTIICSYPDSAQKPAIPIPYCEETMTGFEYALAVLMIAQGFVDEGESIVKAIRDRYDGEKRNPWNEIECGSNYVRSMASYALMPVYSGFTFDMTEKYIGFAPVGDGDGQYLWSVSDTWGTVELGDRTCRLSILGDALSLCAFGLKACDKVCRVCADGKDISYDIKGERIVFENISIKSYLEIELL